MKVSLGLDASKDDDVFGESLDVVGEDQLTGLFWRTFGPRAMGKVVYFYLLVISKEVI